MQRMALGSSIADAFVTLRPDFGSFEADLERGMRDAMGDVERLAEGAGESIQSSFVEAAAQSDAALESIGEAEVWNDLTREAERAGEAIERSFREAGRQSDGHLDGISARGGGMLRGLGGAVAALGIGAAVGGVAKWGLEVSGQLEQTQIGFEGLLGSGEAAQGMMDRLATFAANTPLELPGLADMSRTLIATGSSFGVTEGNVLDFVTTIGDMTASLGGGQGEMDAVTRALGQMGGIGKVTGQDMMQIANALPGFDAWGAIADQMGITTAEARKLSEQGLLPAADAIPALLEGMKQAPGAMGAMEAQSKTLNGVMSTFKDNVQLALVDGLEPLTEGLKEGLADPVILSSVSELAAGLGTLLAEAFATLAPYLPQLFAGLQKVVQVVTKLLPIVTPLIDLFFSLFDAIVPIADAILLAVDPLVNALMPVVEALKPVLLSLGGALGDVLGQVIIALVPVLVALSDTLVALMPVLDPLLMIVVSIIELGMVPLMAAIELVIPLLELLTEALLWLTEPLVAVAEFVGDFVDDIVGFFQDLFDDLVGHSIIPDLINGIIDWFTKLPLEVLRIITGFVTDLLAKFAKLATDLWTWASELPGKILTGLGNLGETIGGWVSGAWTAVSTAISNLIDNAVDLVSGLPSAMLSALGNLGSTVGGAVGRAFQSGVNTAIQSINDFLPNSVGLGPVKIDLPDNPLPKLNLFADGAVVSRPTFGMFGEAGTEAIFPLTRPARMAQLMRDPRVGGPVAAALGAVGGSGVTIQHATFNTPVDVDLLFQKAGAFVAAGRLA